MGCIGFVCTYARGDFVFMLQWWSLTRFIFIHITAHIVIYLRHLPRHTHNVDVLSHTRAREFHRQPPPIHILCYHPHPEIRAPSILEYFIDLCKSTLTKNIIIILQLCTATHGTHSIFALPLRLLSCEHVHMHSPRKWRH